MPSIKFTRRLHAGDFDCCNWFLKPDPGWTFREEYQISFNPCKILWQCSVTFPNIWNSGPFMASADSVPIGSAGCARFIRPTRIETTIAKQLPVQWPTRSLLTQFCQLDSKIDFKWDDGRTSCRNIRTNNSTPTHLQRERERNQCMFDKDREVQSGAKSPTPGQQPPLIWEEISQLFGLGTQ